MRGDPALPLVTSAEGQDRAAVAAQRRRHPALPAAADSAPILVEAARQPLVSQSWAARQTGSTRMKVMALPMLTSPAATARASAALAVGAVTASVGAKTQTRSLGLAFLRATAPLLPQAARVHSGAGALRLRFLMAALAVSREGSLVAMATDVAAVAKSDLCTSRSHGAWHRHWSLRHRNTSQREGTRRRNGSALTVHASRCVALPVTCLAGISSGCSSRCC